MKKTISKIAVVSITALALSGCTFIFQGGRRSDIEKIDELSRQLDDLNRTKRLLEDRLSSEIGDKQVKLQLMEKGLVITFVADVLFDSGKAQIRAQAFPIMNKVARVLKENVPELNVGIEGYTDNQPIKVSGWKTNWELSSARALSVLHYLVDKEGIAPERLSANGFGEYRPVASNDTKEGQRLNRRVEIVILPPITKVKEGASQKLETQENLK